ncbi:MAG TPA: adenosine deaminase, partial [Methyloceanibacter sp.]|nr:adenosine deaminase [Methyloceanibacter sp.]
CSLGFTCRIASVSLLLAFAGVGASTAWAAGTEAEQRTAQKFDEIRADPLALRAFLKAMPKGADLHNHLDGAVYAETFIRVGGEDGLCVDQAAKAFTKSQPVDAGAEPGPVCEAGDLPAAAVPKTPHLYDALVDSFSMRGFAPSEGVTGHDHFFGTFAKFGGTDPRHTGEFLDEVVTRAAAQNEQYLELMETPTWNRLNTITKDVAWREDLGALRDELLAKGLADDVPAGRAFYDEAESVRRERERCGEQDEAPACKVETRFIYQVFRNTAKELVFAQTLFGFELAAADPRVVAINFVGAEDDHVSIADYATQMRIVGFLRPLYPKVHVSLHAGELAPGLVPPEGLCCHVRLAVDEAKTDRIGHGVDVMYEDRPYELLQDMAAKHVLVEINLTSNDVILGIAGKEHPFPTYRKFGVPVALSTDDEGVSRIDLTHEYVRAVETYALTYADLKELVRNSLEYSFLAGGSLWDGGAYGHVVSACGSDVPGADKPSPPCASFLGESDKAKQQWELERRFQAFEASH